MKFSRPAATVTAAAAALVIAATTIPADPADTASTVSNQALATQQVPIRAANLEDTSEVPAETTAEATPDATSATSTNASPATEAASAAEVSEVAPKASESNSPEPGAVPGVGASVPDGDEKAGLKPIIAEATAPEATGEDAENMPEVTASAAGAEDLAKNVIPLNRVLETYKGNQQSWQHNITLIRGGEAYDVWSESMGRYIPVAVIRATDEAGKVLTGKPTYYLLNGAGGSEQDTDWLVQAFDQVKETFENEPVNVVIPMEGAFSYYVDWLTEPQDNPYFNGKQMWSTFLGSELPNAIEPHVGANGKRAVSGFSMSATSALLLAEHNPGSYQAVGSFSGCAATSTPLPSFFVGLTVNRGSAGAGNITPANLWGPRGSEYNRYNDALVMAGKLQDTGTKVYLSAGTGLPSNTDMVGYLQEARNITSSEALSQALTLKVEGGAIEAAMNACTHDLNTKLRNHGVDVTFNRRATGTHSWPVWQDDLKVSWKNVIKPALFASEEQS